MRILTSKSLLTLALALTWSGVVICPSLAATPPPPYGTTLGVLNGSNPNGDWSLYLQDDSAFDTGTVSSGWFLTLTTASPVGSVADAGVAMTALSTTIEVGSNVVFVVGVTNYGPSTASNVLVTDTLPLNAAYLSNSVTKGSVLESGTQLSWNVGTLATNAGAEMTLTLHATSADTIVNSAVVETSTTDQNPDDNVASASVNAIVIGPPPAPLLGVYLGGGVGFQISGTNTTSGSLIIQASTNLLDWIPIFTNLPPPFIFSFTDQDATNYPVRFYRSVSGP
jgi:uncharacterized repeat protein (TIGR01451 family)